MKRFIALFPFLLVFHIQFAAVDLSENCFKAYNSLFQYELDDAQKYLNQEKQINPENCYIYFLENLANVTISVVDGSEEAYDAYIRRFKDRIAYIKDYESTDNKFYRVFLAEMYLQTTIICGQHSDFINAGYYFYKSYVLAENNIKEYPDFIFNKKIKGIHELMMSLIPPEYEPFFSFFGFSGDYQTGFEYINDYYEFGKRESKFEVEAALFKFLAVTQFGKDEFAPFRFIVDHGYHQTDTLTLNLAYILALKQTGRTDKALEVMRNKNVYYPAVDIPQLDYLQGSLLFCKLENDKAYFYLSRFLENYQSDHFVKHTYKKIAWYHYFNEDMIEYRQAIDMIHEKGKDLIEHDRLAVLEMPEPVELNPVLIKARLLYDGGYYNQALDTLIQRIGQVEDLQKRFRVEYYYRLARIYQRLDKINASKFNYEKVLGFSETFKQYFIPFSAYQLGLIAESRDDLQKAYDYFDQCLRLNQRGYKVSIERKAKIARRRVRNAMYQSQQP